MLISSAENASSNKLLEHKLFDGDCNLISHLKRGKVAACIQLRQREPRMIRCERLVCSEVARILRLSIQMQHRHGRGEMGQRLKWRSSLGVGGADFTDSMPDVNYVGGASIT